MLFKVDKMILVALSCFSAFELVPLMLSMQSLVQFVMQIENELKVEAFEQKFQHGFHGFMDNFKIILFFLNQGTKFKIFQREKKNQKQEKINLIFCFIYFLCFLCLILSIFL